MVTLKIYIFQQINFLSSKSNQVKRYVNFGVTLHNLTLLLEIITFTSMRTIHLFYGGVHLSLFWKIQESE